MIRVSGFRIKITHTIAIAAVIFLMADAAHASVTFSRPLKLGMSGDDVKNLQIRLNSDPDTAIAMTGPGSPGNESSYYGKLTQLAVIRYQEKNRDLILRPNGLASGTGFVGAATLAVLNRNDVSWQTTLNTFKSQPVVTAVSTTTKLANESLIKALRDKNPNNPNLTNLDKVLEALDRVGVKRGYDSNKVAELKGLVMTQAASTTDLWNAFADFLVAKSVKRGNLFASVWYSIVPKLAHAQGMFWGGMIYFPIDCTCTDNWDMTVQPLAPNYLEFLTVTQGIEGYNYHNLPFALYAKGEYDPESQCQIEAGDDCIDYPSEGDVMYLTGSSP
jgi:hypothetical protein